MTEKSSKGTKMKPSEDGFFDTPDARHQLIAKAGWLKFYTGVKYLVVITVALAVVSSVFGWVFSNNGLYWLDAWVTLGCVGVGVLIFFGAERHISWGFKAYLDAIKKNDALEQKLRNESDDPIYVAIEGSEKAVSAGKSRLLTLAFIWSKYLVFLIYSGSIAILLYGFMFETPASDPMLGLMMFSVGPVLIFFMARWVFRSEKEIRMAFSGTALLQSEAEALRNRNSELEAQMAGFEGVSKEENRKLEDHAEKLKDQAKAADALLSETQEQLAKTKEQLAATLDAKSELDRSLSESHKSEDEVAQKLEEEQSVRKGIEARLNNLASEFGQNCTPSEGFKALDEMVKRNGGLEKLDADGMSQLAKLMRDIRTTAPDSFGDAKSLSFVSAEEQRINQYDAIVRLYSQKIQKLRSSDMDEEEQQDAIDAMRRLRDREIAELEGAS